jgi:hypothetical protein
MCTRRRPVGASPPTTRSKVTNGSALLQGVDERSASARRFKDIINALSADLGELSEADRALVRTAATLTLKMEMLQADLVAGRDVDADQLIRLAGTSKRAMAAISAKVADRKPTAPSLQDYLAQRPAAHSPSSQLDGLDDDGEEIED